MRHSSALRSRAAVSTAARRRWHLQPALRHVRGLTRAGAQLGDWGRLGQYNQSGVAALMGRKAALQQPDFVISTGDNFYESARPGPRPAVSGRLLRHPPVRRADLPAGSDAAACRDAPAQYAACRGGPCQRRAGAL
jgi:hypothetical protein